MDEVERVCRMPESELKSIYNNLLPKVRHNQNKLFEYSILGDWKRILTEITSLVDGEKFLNERNLI